MRHQVKKYLKYIVKNLTKTMTSKGIKPQLMNSRFRTVDKA